MLNADNKHLVPLHFPRERRLWLWALAGVLDEIAVFEQMIADYNAKQDKYEVILESFPEANLSAERSLVVLLADRMGFNERSGVIVL